MLSTKESERVIVVTGAGSGLGHALVKSLIESGYQNIACQYRLRFYPLAETLAANGLLVEKHTFQADLANEQEVKLFRDNVITTFGTPWAIINVAGSTTNSMSWNLSLDDYKKVIDDNLTSTFLMCREFTPSMRSAGCGRIINVSSVIAHSGVAGASHYCAAKAGVEGFTKSIAIELSRKNITANAVALGYFETGIIDQVPKEAQDKIKALTPAGRFGRVEEFAGVVKYLLSDSSSFMTGEVLNVNGGYHL